jgi:hypothetical protein
MDQNTECTMTLDNPYIKPTLKKKWGELLSQYEFDWACTLTFDTPVSKSEMKNRFQYWKKRICKDERMQIGYCIALCSEPPHLHALVLGANRYGRTLEDVDREKWKRVWCAKNGASKPLSMLANKIEPVASAYAYGFYIGSNLLRNDFEYEISKPKFLKKFLR